MNGTDVSEDVSEAFIASPDDSSWIASHDNWTHTRISVRQRTLCSFASRSRQKKAVVTRRSDSGRSAHGYPASKRIGISVQRQALHAQQCKHNKTVLCRTPEAHGSWRTLRVGGMTIGLAAGALSPQNVVCGRWLNGAGGFRSCCK